MNLLLGIDAGNYMAKIAGPYGVESFRTAICPWFEREVIEVFSDDDMEFEIDGRKGFAGTIAEYEDEFGGVAMFGDSKAHDDAKVRVLLSVFRYTEKHCPGQNNLSIIVGQPVKMHNEEEKQKIKNMLIGTHTLTVNGVQRTFHINGVEVTTEGGGAFWSAPEDGLIRIIDVGSGTVNAITIRNRKHINSGSSTFNFGVETIRNKNDLSGAAGGIIRNTTGLKWNKNDTVWVCGGSAIDIIPFIKSHYVNSEVMNPVMQHGGGTEIVHPSFANAIGNYRIARGVFQ